MLTKEEIELKLKTEELNDIERARDPTKHKDYKGDYYERDL